MPRPPRLSKPTPVIPPLPPGAVFHEKIEIPKSFTQAQFDYVDSLSPDDKVRFLNALHQERLKLCRLDPLIFLEYVLIDEKTQQKVKQGAIHRAIHEILDTVQEVVIFAHIESGKTQGISIGRALWEIGKNPSLRVALLSANEDNAGDRCGSIANYILESADYHEVFPGIRPSKRRSDKWLPNSQITVDRPLGTKDPTIRVMGPNTSILSARIDLLIGDDVVEFKHVNTEGERQKYLKWWSKSIGGRLVEGARSWYLGVPHHKKDILHTLIAERGYKGYYFPVREPDGTLNSPERWSHERIDAAIRRLGPFEAPRQLFCVARDDKADGFKDEWIQVGLEAGRGLTLVPSLDVMPEGCFTMTGVDLAVSKKDSAGVCCFFTILVTPDFKRQILSIWAGRISGPEITQKVVEIHKRYKSVMIVESVSAQRWILQFVAKDHPDIPIMAFETKGSNKWDPAYGVGSLATELCNGRWLIPNSEGQLDSEIYEWIQEMKDFSPGAHTGDRLMASWFAREGARQMGSEGIAQIRSQAVGITSRDPKPENVIPEVPLPTPEEMMREIHKRGESVMDFAIKPQDHQTLRNKLIADGDHGTIHASCGDVMVIRSRPGKAWELFVNMITDDLAIPVGVLDAEYTQATLSPADLEPSRVR